jgi:hypothetical protein
MAATAGSSANTSMVVHFSANNNTTTSMTAPPWLPTEQKQPVPPTQNGTTAVVTTTKTAAATTTALTKVSLLPFSERPMAPSMAPSMAAALICESLLLNPYESVEGMAACYDGIIAAGVAVLDVPDARSDPADPTTSGPVRNHVGLGIVIDHQTRLHERRIDLVFDEIAPHVFNDLLSAPLCPTHRPGVGPARQCHMVFATPE